MGIVIRQSFKATIVSYIGALIGALLVIFIYPKCLTPSQVGLTKVLMEAALFFAAFTQLGMSNAAIKFFPNFKNTQNNHNGFSFLMIFIPFIGFLLFVVIFILLQNNIMSMFQAKSNEFNDYIIYVIPLTLFMMYIAIFETYSSLHQRIVVPKIIKEVIVRILTIIIIILFFLHWINLTQFIIAFVGIYGLTAILNVIYFNSIQKLNLKPNLKFIQNPLKKDMLTFIGFIVIIGIGSTIFTKIDIFMLSQKISLNGTGIYTIAFFIASFIEMPSRAMYQITTPILSEALNNKNMEMVDSLYKRVAINQLIISSLIFLLIWVNADNIYKVMPNGHLYESGKYVIFFIGLSKVYDAATGLNGAILGNSKYYIYFMFFIFFVAILAVINNLIFIPIYGIVGSAIATLITIFLYNTILVWFVKAKLKVQPFSLKNFKALIVISSFFVINAFIPLLNNPYLDAFIRTTIVLVVYLIVIYKFKLSPDINDFLVSIYNKYVKSFLGKK